MQRIKVLAPIFFLLLAFLALRLLMPHSLNNDEAEQVLAASEYVLGYPKQPPLYSWIVRSVTLLFGMKYSNIYILSFLKYFFYGIFIYFLYLSAELVFANSVKKNKNADLFENQFKSGTKLNPAFLVVISNLLFVTYFYDFARDLTHSILATMFAAIGFYVYLRLWLKPSTSGYLLLGIVFGLGFLAKYNFIFFALSIVAASLLERRAFKILINPKTFLSIGACLLVFTPNLIYLIKDKLNAVNYALDRSGSNENQVFSLVDILKSSAGAFYETILVITILLILFIAFIDKKRLRSFIFSEDIFNNHRIRRLFFFAGVFSILIPLLIMLIMGADKFYAKWLSPSCFLVAFAFYSCIDFHKKAGENAEIGDGEFPKGRVAKRTSSRLRRTNDRSALGVHEDHEDDENAEIGVSLHAPKAFLLRRNILYIIVSSCFLVSASVLFVGGFFPDLIGKVAKTQYPYAKLSSILYREYQEELALTKDGTVAKIGVRQQSQKGKLKLMLITNEDPVLKGNLVLALERTEFKKLLESGDCQLKSLNELKDSESGENTENGFKPKTLSLYIWDAKLYGRSIPKAFQAVIDNAEDDENAEIEDCEQSHKYKLVKVRYINSEKQYYELGILTRKFFK
ncbi:MAG: glycosyltransferase family 39 protein [bacterium]